MRPRFARLFGRRIRPERVSGRPFPRIDAADVPAPSLAALHKAERVATKTMRLGYVQLIENAGRSVAMLVMGRYAPASCAVLVGPRSKGAIGLVAARHLENSGVAVTVVLAVERATLAQSAADQLAVCERMGVPVTTRTTPAEVMIDALYGRSRSVDASPEPSEEAARREREARAGIDALIRWANGLKRPIVALDMPSGVDLESGVAEEVAIVADATVALGLPCAGLARVEHAGVRYVADVSMPRLAFEMARVSVPRSLFEAGPIVALIHGAEEPAS